MVGHSGRKVGFCSFDDHRNSPGERPFSRLGGQWNETPFQSHYRKLLNFWIADEGGGGRLLKILIDKTDRSCYFALMASAGEVTRERILEQGLALMSRNGLGGVTLGVLADQVGMSKSGLFAHFKSKDEVQIGLLEHTVKVGEQQIIAPAMRSPEGLPRLKALMKYWLGWTKRAGLPGGCPVAAAMFELDDVDGPVRDWVLAQEKRWCDFLRHNVEQAVTRGQLKPDLDTEQFVWEMCGIYLAHHVAYRFRKARDADRRAETAFEALLARALGEEKAGKSKRKAQAADRSR